jgi:fucose permease
LSGLGFVLIGTGCGHLVSSFFTGRLIERLGIGLLLAGSSALVAFGALGYAFAPVWPLFVACSLMHGLGSGAIDGGLNSYAASHFTARHMNHLHACYCLGAMLGPLVMTSVLAAEASWRIGYASIGSVMLALAMLFLATHRQWGAAASHQHTEASVSIRQTLGSALVWLQMVLFFIYTGLEVTVGQWTFTLLTEARGVDQEIAGIWVSIYWGSIGVGRVLIGFIVARLGIDRLLRVSTLTALAGSLLLATASGAALSFAGLTLIGLALAPIYPCLMTRTPQRLGPARAVHAIGFQVSAAMLGAGIAPSAAGLLADRFGLHMIAVAAVALSVLLLVLHETLLNRTAESRNSS